ncbi:hypothetical protein C1H76_7986 [Elsinoe australis]|uniref:Uncharacterized protein n=1 Tax=Elsinoe australis TaxID=40998 RepID=A0A4U7ANT1_9PEZI|nr:hypothetical protein C1H76_7986 [Elsinoe australis]
MPRTLPWLANGSSASRQKRQPAPSTASEDAVNAQATPKRTRRAPATSDDDDLDFNTTGVSTPDRRARLKPTKTPSTSPPPAPPDQEPMREGYSADDVYMMVEDEFLSTAQLYTSHLHRAEYQRLKKLAKLRETEEVSRPTNVMRDFGLLYRTKPLASKATELKRSDSDDEPWVGNPALAGLMDSPRKQQVLLRRQDTRTANSSRLERRRSDLQTASSKPVQSASIKRDASPLASHSTIPNSRIPPVQADEDDYDDDDLDGPCQGPSKITHSTVVKQKFTTKELEKPAKSSIMAEFAKKSAIPETADDGRDQPLSRERSNGKAGHGKLASTLSNIARSGLPGKKESADEVIAKRRARVRERERRQQKSATADDTTSMEIPTFLI